MNIYERQKEKINYIYFTHLKISRGRGEVYLTRNI